MLQGFLTMEDEDRVLFFVRCFCGSPSTCMWEDEMGGLPRQYREGREVSRATP